MVHGVTKNADLDPALLRREIRPLGQRIKQAFRYKGGLIVCFAGFFSTVISVSAYSSMADFFILITLALFFYARKNVREYPLQRPTNPNEFVIEKKKGKKPKKKLLGDGILLIGNDISNDEAVWISNDNARTHMLVFGSTGSGKTRFLLSIFYQALVLGSGVMYVDGKGDTTVFAMVFSMVRRLGREDDLMVINYLTGSKGQGDVNDGSRLSNTTNPFAYGPAESLRSLIVSLMRGGDKDDMWKGRASALLGALLSALVYMRDSGEVNLDVGLIRDYMPLDRVLQLTKRTDIPDSALMLLKKYLLDLPGYTEADALNGDLNPKCYEQHGYLQMQLTEVLQDLSSTYAHIFNAPLGEVDYKDLVYNRRILFVMLPALEKDPDSLSGLGKLVVAGVRSALAPALGEKVEGSHAEVMEAKPTNSNVPFMLIMDEYGYYSVKGFSVVAAQARSLGMSVIFAGQDFPSFKKGGEDEAKSVVANTNVKIFMKLEDTGETLEMAVKRGGKANVAVTSGYEVKGDLVSKYADNQQSRSESIDRIDSRDLVKQKNGEAHVIFGEELFRCRLYFTEPEESPEYRINRMLMVKAPSNEMVRKLKASRDSIGKLFEPSETRRKTKPVDVDDNLKALFAAYDVATTRKQEPELAAKIAFGMMEHKERLLDEEFISALKGESKEKREEAKARTIQQHARQSALVTAEDDLDDGAYAPTNRTSERGGEDDTDYSPLSEEFAQAVDAIPYLMGQEEYAGDLKSEAGDITMSLSGFIMGQIEEALDSHTTPLSPMQKEKSLPINQLMEIEMAAGRDEEEAFSEARRGMEIIDETIQYPVEPLPAKMSDDMIGKTIEQMLKKMESSKGD
ncbi:type IV secretory system conjugative DNA transfer family protein [Pseudomonas aeruginosa]